MYIITDKGSTLKAKGAASSASSFIGLRLVNDCIWHFTYEGRDFTYISSGMKGSERLMIHLLLVRRDPRAVSYVKNLYPGMMRSYIDLRTEKAGQLWDLFRFMEGLCA